MNRNVKPTPTEEMPEMRLPLTETTGHDPAGNGKGETSMTADGIEEAAVDFLGISWAGIPVRDFEAAIEFFRDRLGIRMSLVDHETQAAHFPLANGDLIEVFGPRNTDEKHRRNVVIALSVENLDQARTELEKAGVESLTEISTWENQAWFYFEGPDGLLFEVKSVA